jgi:anoctamin-10/anoctamin-7
MSNHCLYDGSYQVLEMGASHEGIISEGLSTMDEIGNKSPSEVPSVEDDPFVIKNGYSWDFCFVFDADGLVRRPFTELKEPVEFRGAVSVFEDVNCKVKNVPEDLEGCLLMQLANSGEAQVSSEQMVYLEILNPNPREAFTVFICVDDERGTSQPHWLIKPRSAWSDTQLQIECQYGKKVVHFNVWKCTFNKGEETIRINGCKPINDNKPGNNYFALCPPGFKNVQYHTTKTLDEDLGNKVVWPRNRIIKQLKKAGMEVLLVAQPVNPIDVFCLIRAPMDLIAHHADRVNLYVALDRNELEKAARAGYVFDDNSGRSIRPVILTNETKVTDIDPYDHHYADYKPDERLKNLWDNRGPNNSPWSTMLRLKVMDEIIKGSVRNGCADLPVDGLIHWGALKSAFPLHEKEALDVLTKQWVVWFRDPRTRKIKWRFWEIPIDEIRHYFGEKVAMYFAFLSHYCQWLCIPTVAGIITQVFTLIEDDVNSLTILPFSVIIALWSVIYLENLKRLQAELQMQWGTSKFEDEEVERPAFTSSPDTVVAASPEDGLETIWYDPRKRERSVRNHLVIIFILVVAVCAIIAAIFGFRWWAQGNGGKYDERINIAGIIDGDIIASLMNALQIQLLGEAYKDVALRLNDAENHRTETEYEDALISKVFLFQFCNSYASLFYIAFIKGGIEGCGDGSPGDCLDELQLQLMIIFVTRLVTGNVTELAIPAVKTYLKQREMKANGIKLSVVEVQESLEPYGDDGLFEDYAEMMIQFGYATLFAPAFPSAPLLAVFNNFVELRVDAAKLCYNSRRPVPKGAQDIGTWFSILYVMSTVAVTTNAALLAFTSRLFVGEESVIDDASLSTRIWIFVLFEHAILIIRSGLEALIPDEPEDIRIQLRRSEILQQCVIRLEADDDGVDFDDINSEMSEVDFKGGKY